jgi:hypothetical protein
MMLASVDTARSEQPARLLDEVVAGCEGNVSLIRGGWAKYTVVSVRPVQEKDSKSPPVPVIVTVYFDGDITRCDFGDLRMIQDGQRLIEFDAQGLVAGGTKPDNPRDYSIYVKPDRLEPRSVLAHPRMQGLPFLGTIARDIRAVRSDSAWNLDAFREGRLIKVIRSSDERNKYLKAEYWVDPAVGYGVVRLKKWSGKDSNLPATEMESTYRKADNGAFVVERLKKTDRRYRAGRYEDFTEVDAILTEMSLSEKPDRQVFTIEGLAPPRGARIQDRINDREYLYGLSAVTDADIIAPESSGPRTGRQWIVWGSIGLLGALIAALAIRRRMSR